MKTSTKIALFTAFIIFVASNVLFTVWLAVTYPVIFTVLAACNLYFGYRSCRRVAEADDNPRIEAK
jgi:uncharacterized PurR-regulated membrane protein YhhQ (DUF165 family)